MIDSSRRMRPANRRGSLNISFMCGGLSYIATISRFPDGRLAEIFINSHKTGTDADAAARDAAIVTSIGLQHFVPLETIRSALTRDSQGRASSPLGTLLDMIEEKNL